jgi:hypothetical protein
VGIANFADYCIAYDPRSFHNQDVRAGMNEGLSKIGRKETDFAHAGIIGQPFDFFEQDAEVLGSPRPVRVNLSVASQREDARGGIHRRCRGPGTTSALLR